MIRITSKQEGFRRAGMAHTVSPREYPNDKFSPDQLKALKAEPMLLVAEIPDQPAGNDGGDDLNKMTNPQLIEAILELDPEARTNGLNKAALIGMLQGLQASKKD